MTTVQMLMIMMMMILAVFVCLFLLGVSCDCAKVKVPYIFVRRGDLVVTIIIPVVMDSRRNRIANQCDVITAGCLTMAFFSRALRVAAVLECGFH